MAFAREIFVQIKNKIPFKQSEKEKDSHYAYVGNSIVRISNHCTWMYIWDEILEQNPKDKGKPIISLVFEDEGSTYNQYAHQRHWRDADNIRKRWADEWSKIPEKERYKYGNQDY